MVTQEQLNARKTAAQYIDNGKEYAAEMAEIRGLQEILTPRPVVTVPMKKTTNPRLVPSGMSVVEHLKKQCAAKLAAGIDSRGQPLKPDLVKFLTAMSQAH